jgi:hypothetical protein
MLFEEIIALFSENHTELINIKCSLADCYGRMGAYNYWTLKG